MCVSLLQKIPTSCRTIDKFLEGGFSAGSVSLIYGEPETGKTTLALQCAIKCAERGHKTLFIDCDGTFSAKRLSQMTSRRFAEVAELIILIRPDDFREQGLVIDKLADYLAKNFGLVIIDTATTLYRVKVADSPEKTFELNRELNRQMALLAQVAKTHKVAMLLTSQVRSLFNNTYVSIEPVATRVLKFWAETIIAMKPTKSPQIIQAILKKNLAKTEPTQSLTCYLKIGENGIQEYST